MIFALLDVEDGQPVVARVEGVEVGREAVGHERDLAAVGRPGGLEIGEGVLDHVAQGLASRGRR